MKSNHQPIVKVSNTTVHKLSKNTRKKLDEGSCSIYKEEGDYFFKVGSFVHNLRGVTFGEIKYSHSFSYFFQQDLEIGFIHVLSISTTDNSDELFKQFHDTLAEYSIVRDLFTEQQESQIVKKVHQAYPSYQTKEVKSKSAITKVSKQFGSLVGAISGIVAKPVDKVSDVIEDKREEIYQNNVSNDTKTKWNLVKEKAASLNQKLAQSMKPVNDGMKTFSSKIGHRFNHSDNSFIKAVRDFGKKTKDALNQGYKQSMTPRQTQTHQPLPAQSNSFMDINVNIKSQQQ